MLKLNLASRSYNGRTLLCRLRDEFGAVDAP